MHHLSKQPQHRMQPSHKPALVTKHYGHKARGGESTKGVVHALRVDMVGLTLGNRSSFKVILAAQV